jgi:hypothetical protein
VTKISEQRKQLQREFEEAKAAKVTPQATVEPTYPDNERTSVEAARAELEQLIEAFLNARSLNVWEEFSGMVQRVWARCRARSAPARRASPRR